IFEIVEAVQSRLQFPIRLAQAPKDQLPSPSCVLPEIAREPFSKGRPCLSPYCIHRESRTGEQSGVIVCRSKQQGNRGACQFASCLAERSWRGSMAGMQIDLNCDLGEGCGLDAELMPLITSANISCGFHAGDWRTAVAALRLADTHGVQVGAHPGYPDREEYGRREWDLSEEEVYQ